jgi:hypothetical protein
MPQPPRYCVNCKFHAPHPEINDKTMGLCTFFIIPKSKEKHIVSGEIEEDKEQHYGYYDNYDISQYYSCIRARHFDTLCGRGAKYFEPWRED